MPLPAGADSVRDSLMRRKFLGTGMQASIVDDRRDVKLHLSESIMYPIAYWRTRWHARAFNKGAMLASELGGRAATLAALWLLSVLFGVSWIASAQVSTDEKNTPV